MRGLIKKRHFWIALYGALQTVLYATLLPLWEGFDEPFHYGYVQTISRAGRVPVMGKTRVPGEIWQSVMLVPASVVVRRKIPAAKTFDEYFLLDHVDRAGLRERLNAISAAAPEVLRTTRHIRRP